MGKKKHTPGGSPGEKLSEGVQREGQTEGFSLSGLFTVDLQRQTVRYPTALSLAKANHPDNRIDIDLTGGTVTTPPGWRTINF
jgi:hypothetical protein